VAFSSSGLHDADFNEILLRSINSTISGLLGSGVLAALHTHLIKNYSVVPEQVPYRLDTLFDILENVLGIQSARTIGWAIARDFYSRIGLPFTATADFTLKDYIDRAKKELAK
jgi:hypothetical protein